MKKLKWIILGAVAVLIIGLAVVYFNLNSIVRQTVEQQATTSLNLNTEVGGARVSLFTGNVALDDVAVASPTGYQAPLMFALDGARVDVSYGQLRQDPMRVEEVVIDEPRLVVEHRGGKLNFQVLMQQDAQEPGAEEPLALIINRLTVNNAQVVLRPGIPGLAEEILVPVPSFTLQNIGTSEGAQNAAAIKQVVMLVMTKMAAEAAVSEQLPPEVQLLLKGNIEDVARKMATVYGERALEDLTDKLPTEVGGVLKEVVGATKRGAAPGKAIEEGIQKGLGGLLDRSRDEKQPAAQPK
jgi:hypothetical protein